jgi:hypothetical protein
MNERTDGVVLVSGEGAEMMQLLSGITGGPAW